ncbi:MAG: 50S ribosomal protein L17 [Bacteroidota bacterium]
MRHGKKFNHLSRKSAHRKAMLANMAISLIEHKRIKTTLAKAKALRIYVEPLITKAKSDTTHSRRVVFSYLQNKEAVKELFGEVASAVMDRPGGYTRILKLGTRSGDNTEMALIELVDFNEFGATDSPTGRKSRRRRRRGKSKTKQETAAVEAPAVEDAVVVEETKEEGIVEQIKDKIEDAVEAVEDVVEDVVEEVKEAVEDVKEAVEDLVDGDDDDDDKKEDKD